MRTRPTNEPTEGHQDTKRAGCRAERQHEDHRRSIARNVLANWGAHLIAVLAGFILPRLIDEHIGQERLGLWDFGWSTVNSFMLLTGGIGSAVNRYVAKFRAVSDWEGLNRTIRACMALFLASGLVAGTLATILALHVDSILPVGLSTHSAEARSVVLLLGAAIAIQIPVSIYHGVITGYQRYDLVALAETATRVLSITLMVAALVYGSGLAALSLIVLGREGVAGFLKYKFAYRLCPALSLSVRQTRWAEVKEVIAFGGKTYLGGASQIALYQINRIVLTAFLGPAALALYSRPMSLVRMCEQLVYHFARVMTPLASELQSARRSAELRDLLVRTVRYSVLLATPLVLVLAIHGGPILRIWMGKEYEIADVLAILAVGHLASFLQLGLYQILMGLNRHGVPALVMLLASLVSVISTVVCLGPLRLGLRAAALSVVVPLAMSQGVFVPYYAARVVGLPLSKLLGTLVTGVIPLIPFGIVLLVLRIVLGDQPHSSLLLAVTVGGPVLAYTYWVTVVPRGWKRSALERTARYLPIGRWRRNREVE